MLLVTLDIDGTTRRVSNEELALTYSWFAELSAAPTVKYASQYLYGGYVAPTFGGFTLLPTTFLETVWPPPRKIGVTVQWTETTEADAITLMQGVGYRSSMTREGVTYNLLKQDYDVDLKTTLNDTLSALMATYCGASYLNRTLNTDNARATQPNINYEVTSDTQVVDVLSAIAAWGCHAFYDDGSTIYLYDTLAANGTLSLTEYEFAPAQYTNSQAVSEFKANDYAVAGSHSAGIEMGISPVCHTTQTEIEGALASIKSIIESPGARIVLPMTQATAGYIKPGMEISWLDESLGSDIAMIMRVQSINYDFDAYTVTVEGKGQMLTELPSTTDYTLDNSGDYILDSEGNRIEGII